MDVTFIIDASAGLDRQEYERVLDVAEALTNEMGGDISDVTDNIRVACVSTGNIADVEFYLGRYDRASGVVNRIRATTYRGGDNVLYDALVTTEEAVYDRGGSDSPRLIIIINNGNRIPDQSEVTRKQDDMENNGYFFYTVYINTNDDYDFIRSLATNDRFSTYDDIVNRNDMSSFNRITQDVCRGSGKSCVGTCCSRVGASLLC